MDTSEQSGHLTPPRMTANKTGEWRGGGHCGLNDPPVMTSAACTLRLHFRNTLRHAQSLTDVGAKHDCDVVAF